MAAGPSVEITDSMVVIGGGSYPLAAISSLRVDAKRRPILGLSLVVFGGYLFKAIAEADGPGWLCLGAVLMITTGIGCALPEYSLCLRTSGGEAVILKSRKKADVAELRAAIEAALSRRAGVPRRETPLLLTDMVPSGRVACPHCAEMIQAAARVCRFCGRNVPVTIS